MHAVTLLMSQPQLFKKLKQYFIGDYITNLDHAYEIAKVNLIYNTTLLLAIVLIPISLFLFLNKVYLAAIICSAPVIFVSSSLWYLKIKQDYRMSAIIFTVTGTISLIFSFFYNLETLVVTNQIWFVVMLLFTHFTLGRYWSLGVLGVALSCVVIYYKFYMYDNLHNEIVYEQEKLDSLLLVAPFSFLVIYYLIFIFMKTQKAAEEEVSAANELLRKQRDEQVIRLKEVHHRVKNNLQVINSLLRFQSTESDNKTVSDLLQEAQNRIISMAMLHEYLYSTEGNDIDLEAHLTNLLNDLIHSYSVEQKITTDIRIEPSTINTKSAVPLGLIVNEIVSNSLKYAFTKKQHGTIILHLTQVDDGRYRMVIGDNGIGIQPSTESTNLGIKLIELFVEQLEGHYSTSTTDGLVYTIDFAEID